MVPPLTTRRAPWAYDREMDKRRHEVERRFGRLTGGECRICFRLEKLAVLFLGFIVFAIIFEALRSVNTP